MMKYFLSLIVIITLVIACKKEKVATIPSLTLKSSSDKKIARNDSLLVNFEFTDKEGDVDSLFIIRQRLNRKGPLTNSNLKIGTPTTSNEQTGEIEVHLGYSRSLTYQINPIGASTLEPDTLTLKFVLKDKAGNKSDTAFLNDVIVARQ